MRKGSLQKNKIRNIVLMIVSQLLLTLFVSYWLVNQYQNEKDQLRSKIMEISYKSKQDMINRKVYECVLSKVLEHNDTLSIDSLEFDYITMTLDKKTALVKEVMAIYRENDNLITKLDECFCEDYPSHNADENALRIFEDMKNIMHRYGVRVAYNSYASYNYTNTIPFDLELYRWLYSCLIKSNNIDVEIDWLPEDKHVQFEDNMIAIERYNYNEKKYEVEAIITEYQKHLFKKILPQFLFALVLIAITGFALVFTYRGYIKQVKLNMLRSDFINNITHELKIPVATVKAALEALKNFGLHADPNTTQEYLEMVFQEMNRLDSLTSKVLEHAKLEGQKHILKLEKTDLTSFSGQLTHSINLLYNNKGIKVNYSSPKVSINVNADKVYIESILRNLIDNSIKYGGNQVQIQLEVWKHEKHAYIAVSDNGPGIPKEYINKVFDKFFRVPTGDIHNVKGYGLGLSFADLVMKQHNGQIKAENLKEGGCRFILSFPL